MPPLILVVEDNPRNLKLVRDVLDHVGYRTMVAEDGEQGIELARAHRPDLTLMDVQLPASTVSRRWPGCGPIRPPLDLRVAALTASVMKEDRDRLLAAGFDGFLEKPLDVRAFPAQVAALLGGTAEGAP